MQNGTTKERKPLFCEAFSRQEKVPSTSKFSADNRKMGIENNLEQLIDFSRQVSRDHSVLPFKKPAFRRLPIQDVPSEALKSALFARYQKDMRKYP